MKCMHAYVHTAKSMSRIPSISLFLCCSGTPRDDLNLTSYPSCPFHLAISLQFCIHACPGIYRDVVIDGWIVCDEPFNGPLVHVYRLLGGHTSYTLAYFGKI